MLDKIKSPAATGQNTELRYQSPTIPAQETQAFLRALTAQDDRVVTIGTFTDCKENRLPGRDPLAKTFHDKLSDLYPALVELNKQGAGVFYVANETNLKGRKKENITRIRAVWQDDDTGVGWKNWLIEPNAVIETSRGKFQRLFFTDSQDLDEFDGVQATIVTSHGCDPNATGISRLLRLPGFYHMKNPDNPFMVHVVGDIIPVRWSWDVLKATFPPATATSQVVLPPPPPLPAGIVPPPPPAAPWPIGRIWAALEYNGADDYSDWLDAGMAIHKACGGNDEGLQLWDKWSRKSDKWNSGECTAKWKTFSLTTTGISEKSIFKKAHENGWNGDYSPSEEGKQYQGVEIQRIFATGSALVAAAEGINDLSVAHMAIDSYGIGNFLHDGRVPWLWDPSGLWRIINDAEIRQRIIGYLPSGKVTGNKINSVLVIIKALAHKKGNFSKTSKRFINCLNGELHLENGAYVLKPHNRENYCINQIPVEFDPEAICARFALFLVEVFGGDHEKIQLVYEMIGYCLLSSCEYEKFFILIGSGANGKSVLMYVVKEIVGMENTASVQPSQFGNRFQIAHLLGKLVNIVTEIAEGVVIADAPLKSLSSGELITAEHKNQAPFEFSPYATCIFGTNHMPHTRDFSDALFRRAIILKFDRVFEEHEQDRRLKDQLKTELPGIFTKSIRAIEDVFKKGHFTEPTSSRLAKEDWRTEADQVAQFVEEQCMIEPSAVVPSVEIYKAYRQWALGEGINLLLKQRTFTTRLMRFGISPTKGTGGARLLVGIRVAQVAHQVAHQFTMRH